MFRDSRIEKREAGFEKREAGLAAHRVELCIQTHALIQ
jgi:hypothetical protein